MAALTAPQPAPKATRASESLRLADLVAALSYALDLTGGQAAGWAVRSCLLGMRLADVLRLPACLRPHLYYALLLKDTGCSSNATRVREIFEGDDLRAKRESLLVDWERVSWSGWRVGMRVARAGESWPRRLGRTLALGVARRKHAREIIQLRCERGAAIVERMGFSDLTAEAIGALDERWDGRGAPRELRGAMIPILARVMRVAQAMALFPDSVTRALATLAPGCGHIYDPTVVRAARELRFERGLWADERDEEVRRRVVEMDPGGVVALDGPRLEEICEAFADVVDAKTPFTYQHSRGVAKAAVAMALGFGLPPGQVALIRRAALLHDIGKLGVSNRILEKPDKLSAEDWQAVRLHPYYT
ncbi:MAG: HD-GYP domain-containing protein, partial [Terriglobales bacterium]